MIDALLPPVSLKRSLSDMAQEEMNFFFAPTSHFNIVPEHIRVNESDFNFFPSTASSPSSRDDNDQFSVSSSNVGDSPPPSILDKGASRVDVSPNMNSLETSPVKAPQFSVEVVPPTSKPAFELPSCVRGKVGVTSPLSGESLGIRCTSDNFGESCEVGENGVRTVWYCDRPFPRFEAQLFDKLSGRSVEPVDEDGNPWSFQLSVTDGFGNDASDKVTGHATTRDFPIGEDGIASVAGLRFSSVSSKVGGSFQISITLKSPTAAASLVSSWHSDPIQVLSYRLFHAPKVAFENLKAHDSVGKMKGIGSLYAKRFSAIGVRRIIDLAQVDLADSSASGVDRVHTILNALRKDRGAMTMAKLEGYIQQAREVVERDNTASPASPAMQSPFASDHFLPSSWSDFTNANGHMNVVPQNDEDMFAMPKRRRTAYDAPVNARLSFSM